MNGRASDHATNSFDRPSADSQRLRGYVPGVFDMFHVGHLNIIRAARPHCDWLILGVVADEVVERVKGRRPVVPLEERIEILSELRMVDEVVADQHADKFDTWKVLHFDVIFKGDDWRGTPKGRKLEADLSRVGARIVYFPYTQHTSSTLLRHALDGMIEDTSWSAHAQPRAADPPIDVPTGRPAVPQGAP